MWRCHSRPVGSRVTAFAAACAAIACVCPDLHAQSRRALKDLGHFDPPAYTAPLVRPGDPWPVFDDAMHAYVKKQYQACADLLRRAVTAEPEDPAANFFLAASLMMTDDVGEAEDRVGVVLAGGQTAYQRAARYLLAKASIRLGKLAVAERELAIVADGADHFALDAAGLLPRVRALKRP
jgi:predicted Zn-dependent protease